MSSPTVLSNGAKVSPTVSPRELLRAVVSGQMTEEEYEKLLQGHYAARSIESPCPVDRAEFLAHAKESPLSIKGLTLQPREFSTGSFGWFCSGKAELPVNGKVPRVQVSCTATIIGSKDKK